MAWRWAQVVGHGVYPSSGEQQLRGIISPRGVPTNARGDRLASLPAPTATRTIGTSRANTGEETMTDDLRVRLATLDDIPTIVRQRHAMFAEMGDGTPESLARMDVAYGRWLVEKMSVGEYLGWFALDDDGTPVAGVGLWAQEWPAGPFDQTGKRAYLMNVYTEPPYRGRGLARRLVRLSLDWARDNGLQTALLNASDAGRPIYESLGFRQSSEMRLSLV